MRRQEYPDKEAEAVPARNDESETEDEGVACAAHQVGWRQGDDDTLTLLAPRVQCGDKALEEITTLLTDDASVSLFTRGRGTQAVPLCSHHSMLYRKLRQSQACTKHACNTVGYARREGIMLCKSHYHSQTTVSDPLYKLAGIGSSHPSVVPPPPSAGTCLLEYLQNRESHVEEGDSGARERIMNRYDWGHASDLLKVLLRGADEYARDGGRGLHGFEAEWRNQLRWSGTTSISVEEPLPLSSRPLHSSRPTSISPTRGALRSPFEQPTSLAPSVANHYPAGRRLPPKEAAESVAHAPLDDSTERMYCWGAITHCGCQHSAEECEHTHGPFKGTLARQHWTVQAQLIRCGGLKGESPIVPSEVDGRVKQLREAARTEAALKVKESIARGGDGGTKPGSLNEYENEEAPAKWSRRVHWAPPEELTTYVPPAVE